MNLGKSFAFNRCRMATWVPSRFSGIGRIPMTDSLQISVHTDKENAVIYLRGRVSIGSSPVLRDQLIATQLRRHSSGQSERD